MCNSTFATAAHCAAVPFVASPAHGISNHHHSSPSPPIGIAQSSAGPVKYISSVQPQPIHFPTLPKSQTETPLATRSYASYVTEDVSIPAGTPNWSYRLPIPIPNASDLSQLVRPTLTELSYVVKYASTFDNGDSTIQTDVILTTQSLPDGFVTAGKSDNAYFQTLGYGPRIINEEGGASVALSSKYGIKSNPNSGNGYWSHYIDNQKLTTPVTQVEANANLYLDFNVSEYPCNCTRRALAIEVVASWVDDTAERERIEEEQRQAAAEAARKAQEEEERKRKEAEEEKRKFAEEIQEKMRAEVQQEIAELNNQFDQKLADELAKQKADFEAQRQADEAAWKQAIAEAQKNAKQSPDYLKANSPAQADQALAQSILDKMAKLPSDRQCSNNYQWVKVDNGYQCSGGGHHITWEELANL